MRILIAKLDLETAVYRCKTAKPEQAVAVLVQEIIVGRKLPLSAAEKERIQTDLSTKFSDWPPSSACYAQSEGVRHSGKQQICVHRGADSAKNGCRVPRQPVIFCRSSSGLSRRLAGRKSIECGSAPMISALSQTARA